MKIHQVIDKINQQGENKIIFSIYEDRMNLSLNYIQRANQEQMLKLYTFLTFYLKQLKKHLDEEFESMYFDEEEEEDGKSKDN